MTIALIRRRFRPLLRINDWASKEAALAVESQAQAVRDLEEQLMVAERELAGWQERMAASSTPGRTLGIGDFELGSAQTATWLGAALGLGNQHAAALAKLRELQERSAELKKQRDVIERRREEVTRDHEAARGRAAAAEQDDLWLNRRAL